MAEQSGLSSIWTSITRVTEGVLKGDLESIFTAVLTALSATFLSWMLRNIVERHKDIQDLKKQHAKETELIKSAHKVEIEKINAEAQSLKTIVDQAVEAVDGVGLWLARPLGDEVLDYSDRISASIPIVTIANLKGGVGKTTTTANLAAFYASQGKRVLAIDLDFQGSLSSMDGHSNGTGISAASLLSKGELKPDHLLALLRPIEGTESAYVLPGQYDLARAENAMMVRWLLQQTDKDIRYNIAECLLEDSIQRAFDVILLDCPPRLSTSAIQSMAASTHLIVPTILDGLSVDAVDRYLGQIEINSKIWPKLKIAGVFGTMTHVNIGDPSLRSSIQDRFRGAEPDALLQLETALQAFRDKTELRLTFESLVLPYTTFVPQKFDISRHASEGLAYMDNNQDVKDIFRRLGSEIARRIGLAL